MTAAFAMAGPPTVGWLLAATGHPLVHVNASLNLLATVLLVIGYRLIRQGHIRAHRNAMLAAFVASTAFLVCYLAYHVWPVGAANTKFAGPESIKLWVYFPLLISHVLLAMSVPVLAVVTIVLGWKAYSAESPAALDASASELLAARRAKHRRWARWTFPIWMYVSVTGVAVYLMLYQLYPADAAG